MFFNRRAIVTVCDDDSLDQAAEIAAFKLKLVMSAVRAGVVPDEIAGELLIEASDELSIPLDEIDRRHDIMTGHDAGRCQNPFLLS